MKIHLKKFMNKMKNVIEKSFNRVIFLTHTVTPNYLIKN